MYKDLLVYVCILLYTTVCFCSVRIDAYDEGRLPEFLFSCATSSTASLRLESFENTVGSLRCFYATKNKEDKKPYFNWFDRDNNYIRSARRAPPYTPLFCLLWLKAAAHFGEFSKEIVEASTEEEIEDLRERKIKMVRFEHGEYVTENESLILCELRALVDNYCVMGVYGHKSLFEQCISPARRAAFNAVALEVAKNNEDEFYAAWKRYRAVNPAPRAEAQGGVDSETERIRKSLMGSDDEAAPAPSSDRAGPALSAGQAGLAPAMDAPAAAAAAENDN